MPRLMPVTLAAALGLAACTPPDTRPALAPKAATDLGLAGSTGPAVAAQWWRAFGDPQLDRVVTDALAGDPTLDAALGRLRQAQATLDARRGEAGPDVAFDGTGQYSRLSGRYTIPPSFAGSTRFVGDLRAGLTWNLDLFGRQKAAIEGARAGAAAAGLDLAAARLALAGSAVAAYVELVRAERQAALATRTIAARREAVRLTDARIRNNLASRLDREASGTLLAQAEVALVRARATRALAANAIAALAGRGPDYAAALGPTRIADARLLLPPTIPADLLARRADVAAAQARIAAASANRQVARRAFYPNVNLTALAGLQAVGIGNLFDLDAKTAGAGGAIHLPIFDSGRRRAELDAATAGVDLAIADYNRLVIDAAREASDAIARIRAADQEGQRQRAVVRGFAETGRLNGIRVASGLASRLDLVDNDIRLLDAELAQTNLDVDRIAARAQLAQALGGGFDPQRDVTDGR